MSKSVLTGITAAQIVYDPHPHLYVPDALDPDYYAELEAAYPSMERIAGSGPLDNNRGYFLWAREVIDNQKIPTVWREFFSYHCSGGFLNEVVSLWRTAIDKAYPDLEMRFGKPLTELTAGVRHRGRFKKPENLQADFMLDCQFGINSPVTKPTSVRIPHVDNPSKLFAGLLYFRSPDDDSTGADLGLYRLKSDDYYHDEKLNVPEQFIERVKEVPYRANTLIMWLNTPESLHGVSPRSVTKVPRRYVNFVGESYQFEEGFFSVKHLEQSLPRRIISGAKRIVGMR